jgi:NodT family efflux transporter outer membrane factor (OMF) lipoprotein
MRLLARRSAGRRRGLCLTALLHDQLRRRYGVLLVAAMLTGCAVGPDFQVPEPPPVTGYLSKDRASGGARERVPGQALVRGSDIPAGWWELFHSRYLNQLIEQGILHNTDLRAAEDAVRVAQANALAQRGALFPTAVGNFNASRQKTASDLTSPLASGASTFNLFTSQVTVNYVADVFGGIRRQVEAADAQVDVQAFQREAVYLTLTSNIALAAIQEASLRGQIAATQRLIALQTQLRDVLQRRYDRGLIGHTDVLTQETALAQTRLLLPPLEKQLGQQRDLLALLTGRFPSQTMVESFELSSFRLPRRLPLSLPADLVRQRPDIRVAEANVHAANAQIGVALANRLPQITLTSNAGSTAGNVAKLFSPGTGFWLIAGNAAQTLFDAGTLEQKQRGAEATFDQSTWQYRTVVLTAFQNVADTLRALQADAKAVDAAIAAERAATENLRLIREQVDQGLVNIPVLLIAQQALLQTSIARVQAQAARLADTVALFQALGGGWWNRPDPNEDPREQAAVLNETPYWANLNFVTAIRDLFRRDE